MSDTVGFIRELPHQLVAAFRATLEETIHADLLLHVVDASSPVRMEQIEQVNEVLKEIGADHIPQILVWNKIDAAGLEPAVERDEYDKIRRVFISAQTGAGLDLLRDGDRRSAATAHRSTARTQQEADARLCAAMPRRPTAYFSQLPTPDQSLAYACIPLITRTHRGECVPKNRSEVFANDPRWGRGSQDDNRRTRTARSRTRPA